MKDKKNKTQSRPEDKITITTPKEEKKKKKLKEV